jgi:hypothetical protein
LFEKRCFIINHKSQAAMEFLMTYGWAILVVLIAIGALSYFGVLSPDRFLPSRCNLPTGLTCVDFEVSTSTVSVVLQNNFGEAIIIDGVVVAQKEGIACTYNTPVTLNNNGRTTLTIEGCSHGNSGDRFNGDINVTYTKVETSLSHKAIGSMQSKLAAGPKVPCDLTSVSLSPNCGGDGCSEGESISVSAAYSGGDCPNPAYLVVNADDGDDCLIQYSGGDMVGIHTTCTSGGCVSWSIPSIASDCSGEIISPQTGLLYRDSYTGELVNDTTDDGDTSSGSFTFGTVAPPGSYVNFVCPSLVSGVNDLSSNPISVWHSNYGNDMSGNSITCNCPAGTTMEQITYEVDTESTVDYLKICGTEYSGTSSATVGCGAQGVQMDFVSDGGVSYNDGATQYQGGNITMINCVEPSPPPGASITVAVEQMDDFSDSQAGGDDVVNQLNDNTYGFDFGAVKVDGVNIDTVTELNDYDVVVIGSNGWFGYDDYNIFDSALETWVSNGGGLVATGTIITDVSSFSEPGIVGMLPVEVGSTIGGTGVGSNQSHTITQGVSNFSTYFTITCPQFGTEKSGSSIIGECNGAPNSGTPGVVVGDYGSGKVVYLTIDYMREEISPEDYRSGELDQLMEQAVKWANG